MQTRKANVPTYIKYGKRTTIYELFLHITVCICSEVWEYVNSLHLPNNRYRYKFCFHGYHSLKLNYSLKKQIHSFGINKVCICSEVWEYVNSLHLPNNRYRYKFCFHGYHSLKLNYSLKKQIHSFGINKGK